MGTYLIQYLSLNHVPCPILSIIKHIYLQYLAVIIAVIFYVQGAHYRKLLDFLPCRLEQKLPDFLRICEWDIQIKVIQII